MSIRNVVRWFACVSVAVVAIAGSMESAEADPRCKKVHGTFDLIPVEGTGCTSPVGVCGRGTFKGHLRGDYVSLLRSIVPTDETPQTGVVLITGDTVLDARMGNNRGDLFFRDSGAFKTIGNGEFSELFSVTGGTEDFANASGTLIVTGTYDFAAGGVGEYDGTICVD